jgi:type IV secretion system protein VirB4
VLKAARKKDTQFGRIAEREVDAAKFIPYSRHYDDTTLKTKAGYLLKIIKIKGLPFETADQTDLNTRKNIRATLLRGISNSRFAVYHHTIRRRVADKLDGLFENDWCRELDKTYQDKLSQKNMFVNEQYITIIRRPPQSKIGIMSNITNTIFSTVDRSAREQKDIENLRALNEAVNNIVSTLEPYKPKVLAVVDTDNGSF